MTGTVPRSGSGDRAGGAWRSSALWSAACTAPAVALALVVASVPIGLLAWRVIAGAWAEPGVVRGALAVQIDELMRTLAVVGLVALFACVLGWAMARVVSLAGGRSRGALVVLLGAPLLMPPYLAYAGWSQVRAPGTVLGDALGRLASEGEAWVSVWTGYTLAIVGLALWASPIAGLVVAPALTRTERSLGATLRLDAGPLRRELVRLASVRGALTRGAFLIALVALGSAIPMHLAQLDTLAIGAWRGIAASGPESWWVQIAGSWPVLLAGVVAAWWIGRALVSGAQDGGSAHDEGVRVPRGWSVVAIVVWVFAVGVPLGLFAVNIAPGVRASFAAVGRWWSIGGSDVLDSLVIAAWVGAIGVLLAASGSLAASRLVARARTTRVLVFVAAVLFALGAVTPGIFIGVALVALPGWVTGDGAAALVWAHAARFGIVALGAGMLAAAAEPRSRREIRATDDRGGVRGWWLACVPAQWPVFVGAGIAAGVLSFHEVEASVILTPPGVGSFAQQTLEHLHFFRVRELAAAVTVTMSLGLVSAMLACGLGWLGFGSGVGADRDRRDGSGR